VRPETRYAKSGSVHIGYQVVGSGTTDLIVLAGFYSHLEAQWEEPRYARFLERLASFSRLILLDQRGTGLSDRAVRLPTLEQHIDDVLAVMEAVGLERAAILGIAQGGALAALLAATHPDRVSSLILYAAYARLMQDGDYPWGRDARWYRRLMQETESGWGTGAILERLAPGMAGDESFKSWWARFERLIHSPGSALAYLRMQAEVDIRQILPAIRPPTLVVQRRDDVYRDPGNSRYLAEHIPGARYVEVAGREHLVYLGDQDAIIEEIEEFLTGARRGPESTRLLATLLFTDIVGSTERVAQLGDEKWRELLEAHKVVLRQEIERFRGREVATAGDGFVATFDGPARAVRCALAARDAVSSLGLELRAGLHTGEIELAGDDISGIAVHICARIASEAQAGEVLVSATVRDLAAGSGLSFQDRGLRALKGVPQEWRLFAVTTDADIS
jgi:pimeloyl-ACP methyl ester carboxylesterase